MGVWCVHVHLCMCVHECGNGMYAVCVCRMFGVLCVNVYMCRVYGMCCTHVSMPAGICVWHIYVSIMSAVLCVWNYACVVYVHACVLDMYVRLCWWWWGWCRFRNWTFWNFCWQFLRVPEAACPSFVFLGSFPADSQSEALPSMPFSWGLVEAGCWHSAFGHMVCVFRLWA